MTVAADESSIWHRLLPWRVMTWRERVMVVVSYALLTVAAVTVVRHDPAGKGGEIETIAIWLSSVGWIFVAAGASYMNRALQWLVLFVMIVLTRFPEPAQYNLYREGWFWFRELLLMAGGAILLVGVGMGITKLLGRFGEDRDERQTLLGAFVSSAIIVTGAHTGYWLATGESSLLQASFAGSLSNLSIFLIPLLFAAAADLAEWTDVVAARASHVLKRRWGVPCLAASTVVVAIACVAGASHELSDSFNAKTVVAYPLLFGLATACAIWFARRTELMARVQGGPCPRIVVIVASVLFCGAFLGAAAGPFYFQAHPREQVREPHPFSLEITPGWRSEVVGQTKDESKDESMVGFRDIFGDFRYAVWYQRVAAGTPDTSEWAESRSKPPDPPAIIWERIERGARWKLVGLIDPDSDDDPLVLMPMFHRARDSFRAGAEPYMPVHLAELGVAIVGGLFLLFAALVLRRRVWVAPTGMIFLGLAGLMIVFSNLRSVQYFLTGIPRDSLDVYEGEFLALLIAVVSIIALAWLYGTPHRGHPNPVFVHLLFVLNLALLLVVAIGIGLDLLLEYGVSNNALKGAVIWLAATWDIATAGDTLRGHSRRFPRESRTLLFGGYGLLLSAALLAGSPLQVAGGPALYFQDELWTDYGLTNFGIPLLLTFFVIRIAAPWREGHEMPITSSATPAEVEA